MHRWDQVQSLVMKALPGLRILGIVVAVGVGLIPSLDLAIAASLGAFLIAWVIASISTLTRWSRIPPSLKLLHVGMTLSVLATIARLVEAAMAGGQLAIPSWADAIAVPGILIMVTAFWRAAQARQAVQRLADVLDAVAVATIPIGVVAALTIGYLTDPSVPVPERLLNGGLFLIDAAFLVTMSTLIFGPGVKDRAAVWLALGGTTVVVFDLLVYLGIALDTPWRDEPLRALALAITFYAIATTFPSYVSFAQPGTREQRYRVGIDLVAAAGVVVLLVAGAQTSLASRYVLSGTAAVLLATMAVRIYHSNMTAARLDRIVDAQSALARELAQADTASAATVAATQICRDLLGSDAVTVSLEPPEAPVVASTNRVWVGSWTPPPGYLTVTFTQMARVVDFALDSITARAERARSLATVEATTDPLTGWRNQRGFTELEAVSGVIAVIHCPEVATVTQTHSRFEGDQLITRLAERMKSVAGRLKKQDRAPCFWRGEGASLIAATHTTDDMETIRHALTTNRSALTVGAIRPTISIGAVELTEPTDPTIALIRARMALENGGPGTINWFTEEIQAEAERHWAILSCFRRSLDDPAASGFCTHYQGIVDSATGRPVALEALARWVHPTLGPISPGEFIPIAEQEGMVDALDRWILDTALTDLAQFRSVIPTLQMHVNMSPAGTVSRKMETLAHTIRLQHAGNASALVVELTETAVDEREHGGLAAACHKLRKTGAGLALDDFGTGQSNLARIARLPFSEIKLGADFARSENSAEMLAAMVPTIKALGLPIVAENVETEDDFSRVRDAGVDYIQGYFFSKPSPLLDTLTWLQERSRSTDPLSAALT